MPESSSDPFERDLPGRRLGRYEVLARVASGGMATVYVARAVGVAGFERLFAIKVLHPHLAHEDEFISMFLDEARLAARIRHPNVVPTIDVSDTGDAGFYLVMEYIEGDHLGALLQRASEQRARLPVPVTLRIVVDALNGLAAAHSLTDELHRPLHLVHRDVSPHNIMVGSDGVARLTDFGVAKAEYRLSGTRDGQFKGKLAYMAPEHASEGRTDQRSDLFAMGVILWESLIGRRLFRAENQAATLKKICLEPVPTLASRDPALAALDPIVQRALARSPSERFQTAVEFADALEQAALGFEGLANQRAVAQVVRTYAAAKLNRDEQMVRASVADLTRSRVSDATGAPLQPASPPLDSTGPLSPQESSRGNLQPGVIKGDPSGAVPVYPLVPTIPPTDTPAHTADPSVPTPEEDSAVEALLVAPHKRRTRQRWLGGLVLVLGLGSLLASLGLRPQAPPAPAAVLSRPAAPVTTTAQSASQSAVTATTTPGSTPTPPPPGADTEPGHSVVEPTAADGEQAVDRTQQAPPLAASGAVTEPPAKTHSGTARKPPAHHSRQRHRALTSTHREHRSGHTAHRKRSSATARQAPRAIAATPADAAAEPTAVPSGTPSAAMAPGSAPNQPSSTDSQATRASEGELLLNPYR